jgi:hypothetical protein
VNRLEGLFPRSRPGGAHSWDGVCEGGELDPFRVDNASVAFVVFSSFSSSHTTLLFTHRELSRRACTVPLCVLESNWDTNCGAVASCFFFLLFEFWSVLLCLGPQHVCQMCLFADIRACQPSQLYHPERGASIFKSTNEPGFFCCRRLALGSASPSSCPMWLVWSALGRKLRYGLPYGRRSRLPHKWVVRLRLSPPKLVSELHH